MRDGRRQRLGIGSLVTDSDLFSKAVDEGILNPNATTGNQAYLDRILEEQGPDTLTLDPGAYVNTRDNRYINDAYNYYLGGGTGEVPTDTAEIPGAIDTLVDVGDGGEGQATSGLDAGNNLGFDADVTPGPSGFIGLDPDMDIDPRDITDYGTYDPPELGGADGMSGGQATPGAEFADQNPYGGDGTMDDLGADSFDTFEEVEPQSQLASEMIAEKNAANRTDGLEDYLDGFDTVPEADNSIPDEYDQEINNIDFSKPNIGEISGPATMTVDELAASSADQGLEAFDPSAVSQAFTTGKQAIASGISTVAEVGQSIANTIGGIYNGVDQTVSVFGREINVPTTLAGIALNQVVGAPISLAFGALKAVGGMLPQDSLENSTTRSIAAELTAKNDYGYNMQSGNIGQDPFGRNPVSAFGDYEQTLAEDAVSTSTTKIGLAKKQYAEDYFNAKAETAGGVEVDDGTVVGPAEMPVTQKEIDAYNEPTQEEKDAATEISNAASVSMGADRYGDGGPGGTTDTSTVDDFDDGTMTGVAAEVTGNPIGGFFDAVDNAASGDGPGTTSGSLSQAQSTANIDAARGGNTGSTSGSLSQAQSTANIDAARGGGSGGSGGKGIVCTMMNDFYGFGSFRNKIWLEHSKSLAPEYQKGYHKIFLPLVAYARKNGVTNKIVRKTLEHIAVHRTIDIRQEARGKTHLLGRVYRKILEPICYLVGKYAK